MVLQTLRDHELYDKFSKSEFWLDSVACLGHIVVKHWIEAILKRLKQLRSGLGLLQRQRSEVSWVWPAAIEGL
jgi:hypothetical protein